MCGVAGAVGRSLSPERVRAVLDAQRHRGPDDEGSYADPDHPVSLCHNRLSIIDTSSAGRQPMASPDGDVWLVFNGEIYNYRELRRRLPTYPFRSGTDSEVLLAAYLEWGEGAVEELIGMFSFALWDRRTRRLFCARDRLGIKPFHYAVQDGAFYFASEVKGLAAAGVPTVPDLRTWADYLVHGYSDHGASTFFEGVSALPPGHTLTVALETPGEPRLERYWDLPARTLDFATWSFDEAALRFRELLDDAVRLRLRADVPLGVNLSGGLDSASMMMSVDRQMEGTEDVQTFTASFADPAYDEADFADRVSGRLRWTRHRRRLGEDQVLDLAAALTWHQEAPFGGVATLAYHHLHGLARESGVKVLLEGQGVDELLGGYRYFLPHLLRDLLEAGRPGALKAELRAAGPDRLRLAGEVRRLLAGDERIVYQDGTSHLRPKCVSPDLRALAGEPPDFDKPYPDHLRNALFRDLAHTKLPRVLRMNDRLSMAHSRELREPYLDHRLVELAFLLPGEFKIHRGTTKWVLRHGMLGVLPDEVRCAPKRAVVTPQREWLRGPLAPAVTDLIGSPEFRGRGLFDAREVERELRLFLESGTPNTFHVWQWINTELWFRRFA